MRKTDALREIVVATLPELKRDPERLRIWIERGAGRSVQTASLGFGLSYRLNLLVTEMSSDAALLFFAIFRWMRQHQVDLMRPGADGFGWDCDFIDASTVDVLIQIDVTENVTVTRQEDGSHHLAYLAEPDPMFDDGETFAEWPDPETPLAGVDVAESAG